MVALPYSDILYNELPMSQGGGTSLCTDEAVYITLIWLRNFYTLVCKTLSPRLSLTSIVSAKLESQYIENETLHSGLNRIYLFFIIKPTFCLRSV